MEDTRKIGSGRRLLAYLTDATLITIGDNKSKNTRLKDKACTNSFSL